MECPIVQLLGRAVSSSGFTRLRIVEALGYTNLAKGFRRLDFHLDGRARDRCYLIRLAQVLSIPSSQLEVALEAAYAQEERMKEDAGEAGRRADFARKGPHLWVLLPKDYYPSLITVLGPEFFLLVLVPPEIIDLPDYEQFQKVGAIARAHFADPRRRVREVAGYWFRRSLDETFEFSTEGDWLGRKEGPPPTSVVSSSFRGGLHRLRRVIGLDNGGK